MEAMIQNVRVNARFVPTKLNGIADSLSCLQLEHFKSLTKNRSMNDSPSKIPEELWPMQKLWK